MDEEMYPTIPEIVRALTTLSDRQAAEKQMIRDKYAARLAKEELEIPPLAGGEYLHFEYAVLNSVEDGGYISNMVEIAHSRKSGIEKMKRLVADESVYAIHVRRFEAPNKGVHVYDETQHLAMAQGKAYAAQKAYDQLQKQYDELASKYSNLEGEYERQEEFQEIQVAARDKVIEELYDMIARIFTSAERATKNCTYLEAEDVFKETGHEWTEQQLRDRLSKATRNERQKVKNRKDRKDRETAELREEISRSACGTQLSEGPCAGTRRHPGDCTANADDIPVQ